MAVWETQNQPDPSDMRAHRRRLRRLLLVGTAAFIGMEFGLAAVEWSQGSTMTAVATFGIGVLGATFAAFLDHNIGRQMEVVDRLEAELNGFVEDMNKRYRGPRGRKPD